MDILSAFGNKFTGMVRNPVTLTKSAQFLPDLVSDEPDWMLMKCCQLPQLPAIKWKLQNLARLNESNPRKFSQQSDELSKMLAG